MKKQKRQFILVKKFLDGKLQGQCGPCADMAAANAIAARFVSQGYECRIVIVEA